MTTQSTSHRPESPGPGMVPGVNETSFRHGMKIETSPAVVAGFRSGLVECLVPQFTDRRHPDAPATTA